MFKKKWSFSETSENHSRPLWLFANLATTSLATCLSISSAHALPPMKNGDEGIGAASSQVTDPNAMPVTMPGQAPLLPADPAYLLQVANQPDDPPPNLPSLPGDAEPSETEHTPAGTETVHQTTISPTSLPSESTYVPEDYNSDEPKGPTPSDDDSNHTSDDEDGIKIIADNTDASGNHGVLPHDGRPDTESSSDSSDNDTDLTGDSPDEEFDSVGAALQIDPAMRQHENWVSRVYFDLLEQLRDDTPGNQDSQDSIDGLNTAFPEGLAISEPLQSVTIGQGIRVLVERLEAHALNATHVESNDLFDLYYLLWRIAQKAEDPWLSSDLSNFAQLLRRYIQQNWIHFDQFTVHLDISPLLNSLKDLRDRLNETAEGDVIREVTHLVYNDLYEAIHNAGMQEFRNHPLDESGNASNRKVLTYLYELSILAAYRREGSRPVEANINNFVNTRVFHFLSQQLGRTEFLQTESQLYQLYERGTSFTPAENRLFYARFLANKVLFLLLIGKDSEAHALFDELGEIESVYASVESSVNREEIIDLIIHGNLEMVDQLREREALERSERGQVLSDEEANQKEAQFQARRSKAVSQPYFMLRFAFHAGATSAIMDTVNTQVLREFRSVLAEIFEAQKEKDNPKLFAFNPALIPQILQPEEFEAQVIQPIEIQQKKTREKQEKIDQKKIRTRQKQGHSQDQSVSGFVKRGWKAFWTLP